MSMQPARIGEIQSLLSSPYGVAGSSAAGGTGGAGTAIGGTDGVVSGSNGGVDTLTKSGASGVYGLTKDDFLKLFLAQLQNQDPTKPVDDSQFLGQLAQMTQIDTLQQVQQTLAGSQLASASGMIGKTVTGVDVNGKTASGVVSAVVQSTDAGLVLMIGSQAIKPESVVTVQDSKA